MADEVTPPAPEAQAALPLTDQTPAVSEAPQAAAPDLPSPDAAAPTPEAPKPEVAEPPAEPKTELVSDKPSMLEEHVAELAKKDEAKEPEKKVEAKPEEKKPEEAKKDEAKPAEAKPAEAAPAEIKFDGFKLPDVLKDTKADDPRITGLVEAINDAKLTPQERGQKLIELHANAMTEYANHLLAEQHKAFNQVREGWRKEVMADPEIGGSGHQTAMTAIARMRDQFASSASPGTPRYQKEMKEFDSWLRITGGGDAVPVLRMMHNIAAWYDAPALPPENAKPTRDNGKAPRSGGRVLYDNPRSPLNRQ